MSATRGTDAKISGAEVEETEKSKVTSPTTSGEGEEIKHQVHSQTILIVLVRIVTPLGSTLLAC